MDATEIASRDWACSCRGSGRRSPLPSYCPALGYKYVGYVGGSKRDGAMRLTMVEERARTALEPQMRQVDVQDGVECPSMLEGGRGRRRNAPIR